MTDALTETEVRRIVRDEVEQLFVTVFQATADLDMLRALFSVQRANGIIHSGPLAMRMYVDPATAWRRIPPLVKHGWLEPVIPRVGRKAKRTAGWLLTEKAAFALALSRYLEN